MDKDITLKLRINFRVGIKVETPDSTSDSRPKISDSYSDSGSFPNIWFRFRFRFQGFSKCLIPIPIPVKNGIIPESIPIPGSESCITDMSPPCISTGVLKNDKSWIYLYGCDLCVPGPETSGVARPGPKPRALFLKVKPFSSDKRIKHIILRHI